MKTSKSKMMSAKFVILKNGSKKIPIIQTLVKIVKGKSQDFIGVRFASVPEKSCTMQTSEAIEDMIAVIESRTPRVIATFARKAPLESVVHRNSNIDSKG